MDPNDTDKVLFADNVDLWPEILMQEIINCIVKASIVIKTFIKMGERDID